MREIWLSFMITIPDKKNEDMRMEYGIHFWCAKLNMARVSDEETNRDD